MVPTRIVSNREEALLAVRKLGYPLVAKVVAAGIEHKTDSGGVLLDLRNREDLLEAFDRLENAFAAEHPQMRVMLQSMRSDGVEVIFGAATDPQLGRLLVFGLGGIHVEIFKDVAFRLRPTNAIDAREMVQGIRGRALLQGARGKPPVCEEQLIDVLLRISQMLSDIPEISEFDFNPYFAAWDQSQSCILDARVRLEPVSEAG
ncbi:MAG: acyl-CoA synthetase (NDP forming) [Pseudohongiellaceae bacterium]|jgi:acyl-CoA synthetase (NDP forming)